MGKTYTTHVAKCNAELLHEQTHMIHDGFVRVYCYQTLMEIMYWYICPPPPPKVFVKMCPQLVQILAKIS